MGEKRFGVLLCAEDSEYVKKKYGGYYGVFVEMLAEEGETWDVYRVAAGELPSDDVIGLYDGFVITGSCSDAYGNDVWICKLLTLLHKLDAMKKQILGICFGHQAIYLESKGESEDSFGSSRGMPIEVGMFFLTDPFKTSLEQCAEAITKLAASSGGNTNKATYIDLMEKCGINEGVECNRANEVSVDSLQEKMVFRTVFKVGDMEPKVPRTHDKKLVRVPATMERKGGFSFCLTLEENKVLHMPGDHSHKIYGTKDKALFDSLDCIGRGIHKERNLKDPLPTSQARDQQPIIFCFTTYKRVDVQASSDPLDGLYIGSNGSFATEVIQIRRLFGPWHEDGGKDVSNIETCEFVEAVNLSGNCDMPAGQVAFRARVGEEFKLSPWPYLEEEFGATARYKGEGRLSGFQNSEFVNVEVLILGKEDCREGFKIGVLYSAPEYYFFKLYKKVRLSSVQEY